MGCFTMPSFKWETPLIDSLQVDRDLSARSYRQCKAIGVESGENASLRDSKGDDDGRGLWRYL